MEWIVITALFPFLYKYSFVVTNQFTQIPFIFRAINHNYLPYDWYVNTFSDFGPRTLFIYYMVIWSKLFNLQTAFFINYLFYIGLISFSTFSLSLILSKNKNRLVATLTTVSILFGSSVTLGGNLLVTHDFSAPQLPLGLMLCAYFFLLQKKYISSFALSVVASYLHPLIGFEMTAIIVLSHFISYQKGKMYKFFSYEKNFRIGFITYIILIAPLIIGYFTSQSVSNISSKLLLDILAYSRTPHHYLPSAWSVTQYVKFFTLLSLTLYFFHHWKYKNTIFFRRTVKVTMLITLSLCVIGYIGTEIFPIYHIVEAQLFRNTILFYWLSVIFIFTTIFTQVYNKHVSSLWLAVPLLLTNLNFSLIGKTDFASLIILILSIIFFHKFNKVIIVLMIVTAFTLQSAHTVFNYNSYFAYSSSETELSLWVKNNTPHDALFIIPPEMEKFRLLSERAIVADWKAIPFQSATMKEWGKRMCDLANDQLECRFNALTINYVTKGFRTHTEETLLHLGEKYNADYVISDIKYKQIPIQHSEGSFFVYRLRR